jgi:hydrogenase-4 component E
LLIGVALVVLALFLVLPVIEENIDFAFSRLSLTMALSVLFLGLLMMISRQNAILQVVGFLALENGLALGALGVKGMPLVVEMGIAIVVLVAFLIVGMFVFHIRDRFDDLDITYLANHRGETR